MKPNNRTYRIFSLTMALLIFCSSVGFSIDMHFCQGNFKSFSLLGKAEACHTKKKPNNCASVMQAANSCSIKKKNCCEHKFMHLQADQDQRVQTAHLVLNPPLQQFVTAYVWVFLKNNTGEQDISSLIPYKPPLLLRDIPVLYESFLL